MGNSEFDSKRHWERVYALKPAQETSWYQQEPRLSLSMIAAAGLDFSTPLIDVGGGASRLVDHLLALGYRNLSVLDISRAALDQARTRLASRAGRVNWIEADIGGYTPERQFGLWHDRAAFHFLVRKKDRRRYVRVLHKALAPGGHVVIAAFAPSGPVRCSGLDIVRYDAEKLSAELGPQFVLEDQQTETHMTPAQSEQKFNYFRYRFGVQFNKPGNDPVKRSSRVTMSQEVQIDPRKMASAARKASDLMKTLGHKDRLMVLCHLISGEKSVGELAGLLDIPQSPLSQHLARMRKESLVTTRRDAQTIYYSIASGEAARFVELMHELYCSE